MAATMTFLLFLDPNSNLLQNDGLYLETAMNTLPLCYCVLAAGDYMVNSKTSEEEKTINAMRSLDM